METIEIAKTELSRMIEAAGENGVTESEAVGKLTRYGIRYRDALDALQSVCVEVGAERTPEHTGQVIRYRKQKQESMAVKLAKETGKRSVSERQREEIIKQYKR